MISHVATQTRKTVSVISASCHEIQMSESASSDKEKQEESFYEII